MATNLEILIDQNKIKIEEKIKKLLDFDNGYSKKLIEAMSYSIFSGGKRIRPFLFIETMKMFKSDFKEYIDLACAIEMIHTYSLIHDDLPAMDNDDLRRGKPTCHIKYGEDIAILAGDGLLNLAFEIMFRMIINSSDKNLPRACYEIASSSGSRGMIAGQTHDVLSEGKNISLKELEYIHENKTAAMISASIVSAAIVSGLENEKIRLAKDLGYNLGLLFQIRDDILDEIGEEMELGKTIGKDKETGKNTYPKYFGIKRAVDTAFEYAHKSKDILKNLEVEDRSTFEDLIDYLAVRKK